MKLTGRLVTLVFRNTSCNWILDFLSNRLLFRLLIFMKLEDNTTIISVGGNQLFRKKPGTHKPLQHDKEVIHRGLNT